MKITTRILAILLLLCLLLGILPVAFADNDEDAPEHIIDATLASRSWDEVIADFTGSFEGVGELNVMLGYRNLVTGEEHFLNPDIYTDAASTYKVPLNMLYAEKIAKGEMTLDSMVGAYKYSELLRGTIIDSNNDLAEVLWANIGGYNSYRQQIAQYVGEDAETVDANFFVNNYITARQALTCLVTLYENEERFPNIIDTMKQAEPEKYFCAKENRFEIAHKYGYFCAKENRLEIAHKYDYNNEEYHYYNDTAIIYTDEPIAIVFFSENVPQALNMMADYCTLMCDYAQTHKTEPVAEEAVEAPIVESPQPEAPAEELPKPSETEEKPMTQAAKVGTIIETAIGEITIPEISFLTFVLCVLALAVGLVMLILFISRHKDIGLFWGFLCAVLVSFTLIVCIIGTTSGTLISGGAEGDPRDTVTDFFDAVILSDYTKAYDYLSTYTSLGLENKPDGEAAKLIQKALEQSYSYQLSGEAVIDGMKATQDVEFTYLDLNAIDKKVQALTPKKLEDIVAENPLSKIYDENDQYRPEIPQQAYKNALKEVLADAESYYTSTTLTISLDYIKEAWLIAPDQSLFKALLGGVSY